MKRILFLSCLFIVLHSSSAFCSLSVGDYKQMEIEGIEPTWNEITQDQTSYENWLDYLSDKTNAHYNMPSFSQVADLTTNLLAYSVGNYADVASGVLSDLGNTFSLGSDIWDFMTFNVQQMAFDYALDFVDMLKSGVDEEIYSTPSSDIAVGAWYYVPFDTDWLPDPNNSLRSARQVYTTSSGSSCFVTVLSNGNTLVASYQYQAIVTKTNWTKINDSGNNYVTGSNNMTCSNTYQGSESVGYWASRSDSSTVFPLPSGVSRYSSRDDALAALFGWDGSSSVEPELNGNGIIVNENPVINPVTLTSALGYPFAQTVINNYNNNTPIPWRPNNYNYVDYNYNYDIPFWEGYELETIAYPEEIEFPSVEFETVAVDTNIDTAIEGLSGWIIEFLLIAILLLVLGLII